MRLNKEVCWRCCWNSTPHVYSGKKKMYKKWFNENWKKGKVYCEEYWSWLHLIELDINEEVMKNRCAYYMEHMVNVE